MPENLISDPEINALIQCKILRLQAASLEWWENPDGCTLDEHIIETNVASLDAHAEAYISKVNRTDLIFHYVSYLRGVGTKLLRYLDQQSRLMNPYSEDRLRKMAENRRGFMIRTLSLTPEQKVVELRNEIEHLRFEIMPEALKWNEGESQRFSSIETRFEARYRRWEAEAIERVQRESKARASRPTVNRTNPEESAGKVRMRGPKPDYEAASRVAEIVARVAPDGQWRSKLIVICEALDEAEIPFPPTWRKRDRSCYGWADYNDRANAVKAIKYRLDTAKQRKKTTSETFS